MKQKTDTLFAEINQLHAENIGNAQRTAENAVVIGVKLHQLKESIPHGEFESTAKKKCKIGDDTRCRYMRLAEERLIENRALKLLSDGKSPDGKSSTVILLDSQPLAVQIYEDPELQAIPAEVRAVAIAEVRSENFKWTELNIKPKELAHGLEGKDIGDLYRAYNIIRGKKPKQHVSPRALTPDEKIKVENAKHEAALIDIENAIAAGLRLLVGMSTCVATKRLKANLRAVVAWTKSIRPLTKRKLSPAEKKQETKGKAKALLAAVESCQSTLAANPAPSALSDKSEPTKVAARKSFGWEVTVAFHPGSGKPDKTFHYRTPYETTAKRKAVTLPNFDHVVSTEPVPEDQWLRAYGTPGQRM
jgi:hypothetical protein